MRTEIQSFYEIERELKENYNELTLFERLTLAIQIERNQLLENGLSISTTDSSPPAIEAIAQSLGYSSERGSRKIVDVLQELVDKE